MLTLNHNVRLADPAKLDVLRSSPQTHVRRDAHFGVLTPAHTCAPELAIAAARAGELGLLNLGWSGDGVEELRAVEQLAAQVDSERHFWGVRIGGFSPTTALARLRSLNLPPCPILVIPGGEGIEQLLDEARRCAESVRPGKGDTSADRPPPLAGCPSKPAGLAIDPRETG